VLSNIETITIVHGKPTGFIDDIRHGLASHPAKLTFAQGAANGGKEPILPIFCIAAKVCFREI